MISLFVVKSTTHEDFRSVVILQSSKPLLFRNSFIGIHWFVIINGIIPF